MCGHRHPKIIFDMNRLVLDLILASKPGQVKFYHSLKSRLKIDFSFAKLKSMSKSERFCHQQKIAAISTVDLD